MSSQPTVSINLGMVDTVYLSREEYTVLAYFASHEHSELICRETTEGS